MNITKALSDENRVRILVFLTQGELCLCQILEMLELSPSTVSKHMSILMQSGLVDIRKEGRWHFYHLQKNPAPEVVAAIEFIKQSVRSSPVIRKDLQKLKKVIKIDREELCTHYKN
jgi:DNA-binding transcriptional ArsR family regulator